MRMLRWIQGVSLREHKRNEEITDSNTPDAEANAGMDMSDVESHITRTVLDMEVEGVRPRGRIEIHGYHQERFGLQHSRPQGLEIGSFQGDS